MNVNNRPDLEQISVVSELWYFLDNFSNKLLPNSLKLKFDI